MLDSISDCAWPTFASARANSRFTLQLLSRSDWRSAFFTSTHTSLRCFEFCWRGSLRSSSLPFPRSFSSAAGYRIFWSAALARAGRWFLRLCSLGYLISISEPRISTGAMSCSHPWREFSMAARGVSSAELAHRLSPMPRSILSGLSGCGEDDESSDGDLSESPYVDDDPI